MSIKELGVDDALRVVQDSNDATIAGFTLIDGDTIEEDTIDAEVEVIVPVYGTPYIVYENPVGSEYTNGSIALEGTKQAFDTVKEQCVKIGTFKIVKLVIGGDLLVEKELLRCVITGVTRSRNVLKGDSWVKGELAFTVIP